jgi:hypothetical protein
MTLTWPDPLTPPAGNPARFGGRWRLVGAGLSNVWRYGDLELVAPSGRLLLRGPNGTGKTTALEALWPYLLDLNAMRLAAGKARNTHLSSLMREAADGRRRAGYVWLTFAAPSDTVPASYGVRLNFSEGGTPPVKVTPFTVPGRPLHELVLWGPGRATLTAEDFANAVTALGGATFDDPDDYVRDLATRVFATDPRDVVLLAERIRQVRNPALLGELSPRDAADALRASLPGVPDDVIDATGEALPSPTPPAGRSRPTATPPMFSTDSPACGPATPLTSPPSTTAAPPTRATPSRTPPASIAASSASTPRRPTLPLPPVTTRSGWGRTRRRPANGSTRSSAATTTATPGDSASSPASLTAGPRPPTRSGRR